MLALAACRRWGFRTATAVSGFRAWTSKREIPTTWCASPHGFALYISRNGESGPHLAYNAFINWVFDTNRGFVSLYNMHWPDFLLRILRDLAIDAATHSDLGYTMISTTDIEQYWTPKRHADLEEYTRVALRQLGIKKVIGEDWMSKIQLTEKETMSTIHTLVGKLQYRIHCAINLYFRRVWN